MSETKTKNLCTVPAADLTDSQYFIAEDGGELKRIPKAQVVLKKLENMLATDTENLAGGGEVTAQELLDALAEQVANKLLAKSQVVNNLLATVEGNPLDATQGKALKELIDTTNNNLSKYDRKKLNDGDNLNVKLGPYGSASNNIVGSLLNKPTQVLNGEVTIDWYPSNDNSNYGTQILRHTRDNTINIYFRAKKGSVDNWSEWINLATKNDFVIKTYTIAGKAVNAETIADFEPNIALSGYTPLGIVGTRLNAYGSVTLVYADLVDDTKARVRVRNNGTESVTGDNVIIRVLYFKS